LLRPALPVGACRTIVLGGPASLVVNRVQTYLYRVPLEVPVTTSFGRLTSRPALLVRVEERSGAAGWGEVWCNYPEMGAEYRARMLAEYIAPLMVGQRYVKPNDAYETLEAKTHVLALQTGDLGAIAHALAGIDIAMWDLWARQEAAPLWRLLGGTTARPVPVYASGIEPAKALASIEEARDAGFRAFKVNLGADSERDLRSLAGIRASFDYDLPLMADANQSWDIAESMRLIRRIDGLQLDWLEEPIQADRPVEEWRRISTAGSTPIAAGENLRGTDAFDVLISSRAFGVAQPDLTKWGGFTGCFVVGRRVKTAKLKYAPHTSGAGIGLVASMHLAVGLDTDGRIELDVNENPLRAPSAKPFPTLRDGYMSLPSGPGLGVAPDLAALEPYLVARHEVSA
jgi:L-alanine-DL-glutamate epimerase-like enolase superfamily enzyme